LLEMTNILKDIDKRNRTEHVVDSLTYRYYMSRINFLNVKFGNSEEVPSCEYNVANSLEMNGILFIPQAYTLHDHYQYPVDNEYNYDAFMNNMVLLIRNHNKDKVEQIFGGIHEDVFFSTYYRILLTKPIEFGWYRLQLINEISYHSGLFVKSTINTASSSINDEMNGDNKYNNNNTTTTSSLQFVQDEYSVVKATLICSIPDRHHFNQHLHSILPTDDPELDDLGEAILICIIAIDKNDTFINIIPHSHCNNQKNENVTDLNLRKIHLKNREAIIMNGHFLFSNSVYPETMNMSLQLIMVRKDLLQNESKMNAISTHLNSNTVHFPQQVVNLSKYGYGFIYKDCNFHKYEIDSTIKDKKKRKRNKNDVDSSKDLRSELSLENPEVEEDEVVVRSNKICVDSDKNTQMSFKNNNTLEPLLSYKKEEDNDYTTDEIISPESYLANNSDCNNSRREDDTYQSYVVGFFKNYFKFK